ncbi:MAG: DNA mismatch repair protein MutS [Bacteroidetes bacterium]|nr:MAG: DNA mismatch repair protein MutS [Bacteroidota bacterium]
MKQYNAIKAKHPDALLLFRVGDFYETFSDDAIKASEILGIVLTRRANGAASYVELAGFPHHAIDTYLPKLVKAGQRVAICEQLEDPKLTKKIVKRGVTEMVTPGVVLNESVLEQKQNNFLAAIDLNDDISGISFLDISTGEFFVSQGKLEYIDKLLQGFKPSEVIIQRNKLGRFKEIFGEKHYTTSFDDWVFTIDFGYELLTKHFGTKSLKGFGIEEFEQATIAAGAALHYLSETHHNKLQHISNISRIEEDRYVWLDRFTARNLELLYTYNENAPTLLEVLDHSITPMGSRLLKRWIVLPLKDKGPIMERLDMVEVFIRDEQLADELRTQFRLVGDIERLISKVAVARINPREVVQVKKALLAIENIQKLCKESKQKPLHKIAEQLNPCLSMRDRIHEEVNEDAPIQVVKGNVINKGVNEDLDELREIARSGKGYLEQIRDREHKNTGIPSLKIGYNNVFGYYLEVTNTHKDKVPEEWHRKQTLVNSERYITEELKDYEQKILGAEEKILALETRLFNELVVAMADYIKPVQLNASLIARLDCLLSFASVSEGNNYTRPEINDSLTIDISDGRHPVIEKNLPPGEAYIPNNTYLDNEKQQIIMLTGPNMSGKSALLRQTALITLMAQMGCFVPAKKASIGLVDKIFTRVGASDNIASGESTFMVEMNETASILNNISDRSLILLDEIGRGTSTYDGISIAWAITEYIHNHPIFRAKVMFATHYHELNEMSSSMKRIKNFHISIKEVGNEVIFLRKIEQGGSEHSFGIHVARMAGMPSAVLRRAHEMLAQLEQSHSGEKLTYRPEPTKQSDGDYQLSFIQLDDPLLLQIKEDILNMDINTLTPVEALMKLNEIKRLLGE